MLNTEFKRNRHSFYNLNYYLVVSIFEDKKIIYDALEENLKNIILQNIDKHKCELIDITIEEQSKVIIHFSAPPHIKLSSFVNNLKTVSSRLIRRDFKSLLERKDMGAHFWDMEYHIYT
ncbi:IS200/IS605 family transposase [Sulfurimonas sp.]|uniref:IS200/IS605 family transposase n=1 Tax=Sulfurimonas sp. TaxID=2022749 RepID=UPI003458B816|nr:IS200/IS605 family transposase [Sulfurimonas sp.]